MFGITKIATVNFNSNKNCFLSLPNSWAHEYRRKEVSVFELQWGESGKGYLSWAGDVTRPAAGTGNSDVGIQINGLLGSKLGLRHSQEVLMKPVTSVWSCYKLDVEPASVDDWEILELNASHVENNLLNQVRVVWVGQVLPVWIDRKMCVFIKVSSIEPDAPCVRLEQHSQLTISAKNRLSSPRPAAVPRPDALPGLGAVQIKSRSDSGSAGSSSSETSGNTSVSGYISDFDSMNSYSSGFENNWSHDTGQVTQHEDSNTPKMPWEVHPQDIEGAVPWSYKVWRKLRGMIGRQPADSDRVREDCSNEEDARRKMTAQFWRDVRIMARVQPMFNHRRSCKATGMHREGSAFSLSEMSNDNNKATSSSDIPPLTRKTTSRFKRQMSINSCVVKPKEPGDAGADISHTDALSHLMQPTTVYLSTLGDAEFLWQYAASMDDESVPSSEYVTFLANMTKMPSPRERSEDLKKKLLSESKREQSSTIQNNATEAGVTKSTGSRLASSAEKPTPKNGGDEGSITSSVVRIIVHCHELKSHCRQNKANPYSSTVFHERPTEWYLQVPDLLRRQMGLELSAMVQLKPVVNPPSPIRDLTISPLFDLTETIDETRVLRAFSQWLTSVSCMITPIPIVQHRNLLSFTITADFVGEVLLSVNQESVDMAVESYFLLHPLVTRQADLRLVERSSLKKVTDGIPPSLPVRSVDELDAAVKGFRLRELGKEMSQLGRQAMDHVCATLSSRPLGRKLGTPGTGQRHGGVLVWGRRGCGKSTLARAVCREVSEWPLLAYVKVVECHSLKGKGVDKIRKILEEAFNEAAWRQPSVILLDDLDHVAAASLGPEQESGPEAVYNSRLAQVIKDLLGNEMREGSHIAIIATCASKKSIHQSLLSSRGLHLFQSCLEIAPLSKIDRSALLASVIRSKVEIDLRTFDHIDLEALGTKMEGFVANDLVTVTERAVHAGSKREIAQGLRPFEPIKRDADHPSNEILLCQEDFEFALHSYSPAALRDVPLHSAGELGWKDVGGLKAVKQDLIEILELPAKYPDLFTNCPLRLRSGLLLYGPPGTGKTLLGGVVAKECGLNFISIKGPELLSKYIGASEQAVRGLFTRAMSAKPCILFFDEFDSLAPRRGHDSTGVTDRVVNQLLTQLDGVEGLEGVYVIGATSRPDLIDPALLRPGRLDKCLYCPIPNAEERVEILEALARNMTLSSDVNLVAIARELDNFTGADLKALLYNAQLEAIHSTLLQGEASEGMPLATPRSMHDCSMEADEWRLTFLETFSESEPGGTPLFSDEAAAGAAAQSGVVPQCLASLSEAERALAADNMKMSLGCPRGYRNDSSNQNDSDDKMDGFRSEERGISDERARSRTRDLSHLRLDLTGGVGSSDLNGNVAGAGAMSRALFTDLLRSEPKFCEHEEAPSPPEGSVEHCSQGPGMARSPPQASGEGQQRQASPMAQQQQRVVVMPSLRDGAIDPTPETKEIIANEVAVILENYIQRLAGNNSNGMTEVMAGEDQAVIRVTQTHLTRAAQSMRPSVTAKERQRYQQIYETFVRSRGGDFPQSRATGSKQKVTLA